MTFIKRECYNREQTGNKQHHSLFVSGLFLIKIMADFNANKSQKIGNKQVTTNLFRICILQKKKHDYIFYHLQIVNCIIGQGGEDRKRSQFVYNLFPVF